jgi:hypothetical protein
MPFKGMDERLPSRVAFLSPRNNMRPLLAAIPLQEYRCGPKLHGRLPIKLAGFQNFPPGKELDEIEFHL